MTLLAKTLTLSTATTTLSIAGFWWPAAWVGAGVCAAALVALVVGEAWR